MADTIDDVKEPPPSPVPEDGDTVEDDPTEPIDDGMEATPMMTLETPMSSLEEVTAICAAETMGDEMLDEDQAMEPESQPLSDLAEINNDSEECATTVPEETVEETDEDQISTETEDEPESSDEDVEMIYDEFSPNPKFADNIEGFGYRFDSEGKFKNIRTGSQFEFNLSKSNPDYNQRRYEQLGEVITEHVYSLLDAEGLKRVYVPEDAGEGESQSFVFVSEDFETNTEKLLVLIHGSGVVRAGQWARRLIINHSLDSGTQLPYIRQATKDGYAVITLNTNLNYAADTRFPIRENSNPEEHATYVWDNLISKSPAEAVVIVAHSYGGIVTVELCNQRDYEFLGRVKAIAFTDSIHSLAHQTVNSDTINWFKENSINWISAFDPIDTPVDRFHKDCPCRSAGTPKHEMTSFTSMKSIFKFFKTRLSEEPATPPPSEDEGSEKEGMTNNNCHENEPEAQEVPAEPQEEDTTEPDRTEINGTEVVVDETPDENIASIEEPTVLPEELKEIKGGSGDDLEESGDGVKNGQEMEQL